MTWALHLAYPWDMMNRWQHTGAFLLQLRSDATLDARRWQGRVEHLSSGQTLRFESLDELVAFLEQVLKDSCGERSREN